MDIGEHGGPHEIPRGEAVGGVGATGEQLGSLVDTFVDVTADPLPLGRADQGPELGVLGKRVARGIALGCLEGELLDLGQFGAGARSCGSERSRSGRS